MDREDYFFGEISDNRRNKVYALVIYDIVENTKRTKFARFLSGYGNRVQKSAFEVSITEKKFDEMLRKIPSFCTMEDSIRVYRISGKNLVHKWGIDYLEEQEDIIII